jgi:hypothetical protein
MTLAGSHDSADVEKVAGNELQAQGPGGGVPVGTGLLGGFCPDNDDHHKNDDPDEYEKAHGGSSSWMCGMRWGGDTEPMHL